MTDSGTLAAIYRYPVKGLSGEPLPRVVLARNDTLPADRRYAIENGPSGFDPAAPAFLPKSRFLMLMRHERLAELQTRYDTATHVLVVRRDGSECVRGDLSTAEGRAAVEAFFARHFPTGLRGPPRIVSAPGFSFSDVAAKVVSVLNLASVAALERALRVQLNPLRFRANLHVDGWPAWSENDAVGADLGLGAARLRVVDRIRRCAATDVDPNTGRRDGDLPGALQRHFGHAHCGVYAEVTAGGPIAIGDRAAVLAGERLPF